MKVIIVGGVAGGATAAARIRRLNEKAEITVYERSGYISYANCGLPYYVGDVITDAGELTLQTPESFDRRFRVSMKVEHEVIKIEPEKKTVTVKKLKTGEIFEDKYDKLLLSPGAKAIKPDFLDKEIPNIFTLRTVEDSLRIKEFVIGENVKSALIVGGGFIGVEMAENLRELGIQVSIVEYAKQLMSSLDADMATFIHTQLREKGVKLHLASAVQGFAMDGRSVRVQIQEGKNLTADMVILAMGVSPDTALAKEAGLELGMKGSILVNDRMESSIEDIYAVGDAVQVKHFVSGDAALISLAGPANKQGRIAADNICGKDSHYHGSQGSSVLKLFDMTVASTGLSETLARKLGMHVDKVILSPMNHAGYYPDGKIMTMKVVFEKGTYRLLGAQIIGYDGVDKRIDVLATAIRAGMNAVDLKELELSYAPPFSSAKDPVNMAGFMIENLRDGIVKQWYVEDIEALSGRSDVVLLDVRTKEEFDTAHVEGFLHIPVDELRSQLTNLPKQKPIYLMCQSGLRSYIASRILLENGFDAYNFAGGYRYYSSVMLDRRMAERASDCGMDQRDN